MRMGRNEGRRAPTQADIARAANVSTATVSRVLNDSPLVRPDVRKRVEQQIKKLGYFPHGAARALASNRSFTIGAVIPTLGNAIFANSVNALEARLAESNYTLLLAVSNYSPEAEAIQVRRLLERGIDGLMLIGNDHPPETYKALERAGTVYVNTWNYDPSQGHPNIGFSNRTAMAELADHIVALGHTSIGMLAGITAGNDRAYDRLEGLRDALAGHGIALEDWATREVPYSIPIARAATAELIENGRLPTALLCGNDVIALGVLFEAAARGIRIPEDLSVAGFDNLPLVEHIRPALTTVNIPTDEMGSLAADVLLEALATGSSPRSIDLGASLLVRETTGPARGTRKARSAAKRRRKG